MLGDDSRSKVKFLYQIGIPFMDNPGIFRLNHRDLLSMKSLAPLYGYLSPILCSRK